MDCENFDRVVMDLLYEELDEIASAAMHRHMAHCGRCRRIGARLRATRAAASLPLLEPPAGMVDGILIAEKTVTTRLPARQRFGRAISVMAGLAMRPQAAMAALLLLMIGASLLLLRAHPGQRESVQVTERGVPETEADHVSTTLLDTRRTTHQPERSRPARDRTARAGGNEAAGPTSAGPAADAGDADANDADAASPAADAGLPDANEAGAANPAEAVLFNEARAAYHAQRFEEARRLFDRVAAAEGAHKAAAALLAAHALRNGAGCASAVERFARVAAQYPDSDIGQEAAWESASCYRSLGDRERARALYSSLTDSPKYGPRARKALERLPGPAAPVDSATEDAAAPAEDSNPDQTPI
ncbi:MAG: tetratricopeptide repeat protein [Polyangiaceae bacterium]|nr:tetratricopeptide repeat protein [Polyangiaceae bacterium]